MVTLESLLGLLALLVKFDFEFFLFFFPLAGVSFPLDFLLLDLLCLDLLPVPKLLGRRGFLVLDGERKLSERENIAGVMLVLGERKESSLD